MISPERETVPKSRLFIRHQKMLKSFIRSLVPHKSDAEDILQEVGIRIVAGKADLVDPTAFPAWARGMARNLVLHHRRAWRRRQDLPSTRYMDLVESAFAEADAQDDLWNHRRTALSLCLQGVPSSDRELLTQRYVGSLTADAIANQQGRTAVAVRVALLRLRRALLQCVKRRLGEVEGRA